MNVLVLSHDLSSDASRTASGSAAVLRFLLICFIFVYGRNLSISKKGMDGLRVAYSVFSLGFRLRTHPSNVG